MSKRTLRLIGFTLLIIAGLTLLYGIVGYYAWQAGERARTRLEEEQRIAQIGRQKELVATNLAEGNVRLASKRLEWLQANAPDDTAVSSFVATVSYLQQPTATPEGLTPTPTITMTPVITTSAEPLPTPDPSLLDEQIATLETMLESKQWEESIKTIIAFQLKYPNYQRRKTDELLFTAYTEAGFAASNAKKLALGISYFDQAAKLGALPDPAISQRYYSKQYLSALSYSNLRWDVALPIWEELCYYAPLFHDPCSLLHESLLSYGAQLVAVGNYCPALALYQKAQAWQEEEAISKKISELEWKCASGTPTRPATRVPTATP